MTTEAETIDPHAEWNKQFDYWLAETAKAARLAAETMERSFRKLHKRRNQGQDFLVVV